MSITSPARCTIVIALVCSCTAPLGLSAQQVIDAAYRPRIVQPTYPAGAGPVVLVDTGHNTFHAHDEHFGQLAEILIQDGYRVAALRDPYSAQALAGADVLIVVNALADRDVDNWVLPTSPAFTPEEVSAVREWVENGGSLLLIADHMPFPGAAADLGEAFGVEFMNGFAIVEAEWDPLVFRRSDSTLRAHPITDGRSAVERVDSVVTFVSGHAFHATDERVCPLLVFGAGVVSINMERAWVFDDATPRVPVEGWLQGAAVEAGDGRVAIFGEAAMFAAQLVGPRRQQVGMNAPAANQNLQLLLNTLRWLSRAPGPEATSPCVAATPPGARAQQLMTTAANVRLRAEPDLVSSVRAMLRLGTELTAVGSAADGWTPVRAPSGERGWVASELTRVITDSTRLEVARELIRSRLDLSGDSFNGSAELVHFVEDVLLTPGLPRDDRARIELARLEAIRKTAQLIPFYRSRWSPRVAAWVEAFDSEIQHSEPGGEWILRSNVIWERQREYQSTGSADDFAWFAVENGLGGECEGFLVCYLERANLAEGEYLRRRPRGHHAETALQQIRHVAALRHELTSDRDHFDPQMDCAELQTVTQALLLAVRATAAPSSEATGNELSELLGLCRR